MGKEIDTQIPEAQKLPYRINPRANMPIHVLTKLTKIKTKGKMLKSAREKQRITYKEIPIKLTAGLSTETAVQKGVEGYI